ncbi:putative BTB/POZ domain-containing protein [Powai lake megavirus]|uniref:Putative BTB/POZ domain-containing protein n=1 Tax=Powai lake megavirus TaxID=1842663 RepID=A0A160ERU6_9VIRU|nr:putative BTB/POZ domain-containing protein [Powai lake megavirus]ANB51044.1 putative BTB/POZ domain-containing protein [Powai lake megavirus]
MDNIELDICLTLCDDDNQLVLNSNRKILSESCSYFEKLLSGNFTESIENKITIFVPNVAIVNDIIASFYGSNTNSTNYPNWEYYLQICLCRDFLMLDCSIYLEKILNANIPDQYFDSLLNVLDIIKRDLLNLEDKLVIKIKNNEIVKYVSKNMPKNFDTSLIPKNINNDINLSSYNNLLLAGDNGLIMHNYTTDNSTTLPFNYDSEQINFIPNTNQLVLNNKTITFVNILTGDKTLYLENTWNCCVNNTYRGKKYVLDISDNNKYLVCGSADHTIKLFDIEEKKLIRTWYPHLKNKTLKKAGINHILFTPDNQYIIVSGYKNTGTAFLNKYDLEGNLIWSKKETGDFWHYVDIICLNDKIVLLGLGSHYAWLEVINLETGTNIYHEDKYDYADYFCPLKNNCIAIENDDTIYVYDIDKQQEIAILGEHEDLNNLFYNKNSNHLVSSCKNKIKIWDPELGLIDEIMIDNQIISPLFDYKKNLIL